MLCGDKLLFCVHIVVQQCFQLFFFFLSSHLWHFQLLVRLLQKMSARRGVLIDNTKHTKKVRVLKHTSSAIPSKSGRSSPPMLFIIWRKRKEKISTSEYLHAYIATLYMPNILTSENLSNLDMSSSESSSQFFQCPKSTFSQFI